jgi:hypothetical protein
MGIPGFGSGPRYPPVSIWIHLTACRPRSSVRTWPGLPCRSGRMAGRGERSHGPRRR